MEEQRKFMVAFQLTGNGQSGVANIAVTVKGAITEAVIRDLEEKIRPRVPGLLPRTVLVIINLIPLEG